MHRLAPLVAALSLAFPAAAQVRFQVTPIGTLGGATSRAIAIADDGTVVGESTLASGQVHAFSFRDGTLMDLDSNAPAFVQSAAYAVRDQGLIAGTRSGNATLYEGQRTTMLGGLGGGSAIATGINADGRVVGKGLGPAGLMQAFYQRPDGSLETLSDYGGQAGAEAVASGGIVHGWATSLSVTVPMRWIGGNPLPLDAPTAAVWRNGLGYTLIPGDGGSAPIPTPASRAASTTSSRASARRRPRASAGPGSAPFSGQAVNGMR
jgi:probable HAF family extracellular repeat protein